MKKIIKKYLKIVLTKTNILPYINTFKKIYNKHKRLYKTKKETLKKLKQIRLYKSKNIYKLINNTKVEVDINNHFVYSIDTLKQPIETNRIIGNITVDYERLLNTSLSDFENENNKKLIDSLKRLINKIEKEIKNSNNKYKEKILENLEEIKTSKATTLYSGMQRILFYNQVLWQTGHRLNGLGRLDKILQSLYEQDIKKNILTKENTKELITDFYLTLHKYYWFKSNVLMGDTGQIIILGGKNDDDTYFYNELTYIFIETIKELQIPDPKILLRVSSNNMPKDLIELAVKCIQTGIGCPLFSNDDVIIPKLIDFGYEKQDAYNYVTAACWEPIIPKYSLDQTNIMTINFLKPFNKMLANEDLNKNYTIGEILQKYTNYLKDYCNEVFCTLNKIEWQFDSYLSLLTSGCELEDISIKGAKYNHYGVNSVGLASVVNSIINIKKFVFDEQKYTLEELNNARKNNFNERNDIVDVLKNTENKYGVDNEEIINLTNYITGFVDTIFSEYRNKFNGKLKFGLSSPSYITEAEETDASLDGRKDKEPFTVHISTDSSNAYTELIQFASKLNYSGHRFNGNVVDFIVAPDFIENNFQKFIDFITLSIKVGFFQMQMNVLSSKTLIEAKLHPEQFPNLIVRVWGFSAYFKDLPEEYKEVIIQRALKNEGKM